MAASPAPDGGCAAGPGRTGAAPLAWEWLGRVPYAQALAAQRERREAVIAGTAPEVVWLLEHDPVITLGRRPAPDLPPPELLASRGLDLVSTERGGLATWHGPGQLVIYAIIDASSRGLWAKGMVAAMTEAVAEWLRNHGLDDAHAETERPGVWAMGHKLCSIGLHFQRGVSMHGAALNLDPDLSDFALFAPCGMEPQTISSLARLAGNAPSPCDAARSLGPLMSKALERG